MKQSLQLKLSQHLTLTPQLQQSIRLLQLSTLELNQELDRFLMENPLLERTDLANESESLPSTTPSSPVSESPPQEVRTEGEPCSTSSKWDTGFLREKRAGLQSDREWL